VVREGEDDEAELVRGSPDLKRRRKGGGCSSLMQEQKGARESSGERGNWCGEGGG
jgi:hypothetical protein